MATLYQKPNSPYYYAQFFDANGKRVSKSTGTTKKREAERLAADYESEERKVKHSNSQLPKAYAAIIETAAREAVNGELTLARAEDLVMRLHRLANPSFRVVSLENYLEEWVKAQAAHVKDDTISVYSDMKRHFISALGSKIAQAPVGDLTKEDVEAAQGKLSTQKIKGTKRVLTNSTVNLDLRTLRRALQSALEAGLTKANVAKSVKQLPEDDSTERAPFTVEEVRAMLDHPATSEEWHAMILFGAHTGLRLGDIAKLTSNHIDGTNLKIRQTKTKRSVKKPSTIKIPLSPPLIAWVMNKGGTLFPKLSTLPKATLSTQFVRLMAKAGVAKEVLCDGEIIKTRSFHSFRHTFSSWLAEADIHADVRQKLTGHKSSEIHQGYTHHDKALDRAIKTLPAL